MIEFEHAEWIDSKKGVTASGRKVLVSPRYLIVVSPDFENDGFCWLTISTIKEAMRVVGNYEDIKSLILNHGL